MEQWVANDFLKLLSTDRKNDLLDTMMQALHTSSEADFTFVAEVDNFYTTANTHLVMNRDGSADNFSFDLKATPCSDVLVKSTLIIPFGVQEAYPDDQLLVDWGINGYIGTQLTDIHEKPVGILVALFKNDISNSPSVGNLFNLFSGLISREFDRKIKSADVVLAKKVLDSANDGIIIAGPDKKIIYANTAICNLTGYANNELVGETPAIFKSAKNLPQLYQEMWSSVNENLSWSGEIWNRVKSGEVRPFSLTITSIMDNRGTLTHYSGIFQDIFERKKTEAQILYQATHDLLTGLKNRYCASDKLEELIKVTRRYQRPFSIILIDIDHFKAVNDNYGHQIGDQVLQAIGQIILDNVRTSDLACRWGGEEFMVICQECSVSGALELAEKLRMAIEQTTFSSNIKMTASFGAGQFRQYEASDSLLIRVDDYLYQAKGHGRNCVISSEILSTT